MSCHKIEDGFWPPKFVFLGGGWGIKALSRSSALHAVLKVSGRMPLRDLRSDNVGCSICEGSSLLFWLIEFAEGATSPVYGSQTLQCTYAGY